MTEESPIPDYTQHPWLPEPEEKQFVLQITDADGFIFYLAGDEDPVASFGEFISVVRFEITNPKPWSREE